MNDARTDEIHKKLDRSGKNPNPVMYDMAMKLNLRLLASEKRRTKFIKEWLEDIQKFNIQHWDEIPRNRKILDDEFNQYCLTAKQTWTEQK